MAREDEEDEEHSSDIPSFEDLVEELGKRNADPMDSDGDEQGRPSQSEDLASPSTSGSEPEPEPSEESWDWVENRSSREDESSTDTSGVDSLWDESEAGIEPGADGRLDVGKSEALIELIGDTSNLLLVGSEGSPVENEICSRLCELEGESQRRRLLITTQQSADARLESLDPYTEGTFEETTLIVVGEQVQPKDDAEPATHEVGNESVVIETLHNPQDVTRLGVIINKYLSRGDTPPVVCFHTLTEILRFVGVEKMFRFLHVLQARVRSVGARAHYHIDPESVDEQAISTLKPLFDFTFTFDHDGTVSVDSRD